MANIGYIQLTRICNQKCIFCSNPELGSQLSYEEAKKKIDQMIEQGYYGVILTGGEPTLHPQLPELIEYASDKGFHVRIITNCQRTADLAYVETLVKAGLRHLHASVYTDDPKLQGFLTSNKDSLENFCKSMDNFAKFQLTVDVNITIQKYNADHLDRVVRWVVTNWPYVKHFVFNNLDPTTERVKQHPESVPRLRDFEISLYRAMRFLDKSGRTFRVERVPLCYMVEYAHCSTETRKIVKSEPRTVVFLDERGEVNQTEWQHGKAEVCKYCFLNSICAGLFEMDTWYSSKELYAVFVPKEAIIAKILADRD